MFGFPYRLIDPEQFPFRASAGALEAVAGYARQARGVGQGIIENVTAVHQVWKNLDENIRTSVAPDLPERFGPIAHDGKDRGQALLDSADAMDLFVKDMSEHHDDLKKVTREARALHDEVVDGVWIDGGNLRNPAVTTSGAASANPWDGSGAVMPIPGEQVQIPWHEHVPSLDRNQALWTRHDAVAERIREAKQALNDRLVAIAAGFGLKNGKIPSQARQTLGILADAGLDEVDEMTADKIGQAIAQVMGEVVDDGKSGDGASLERLLDQYGEQPAVMNSALSAAGAGTVASVLDRLGRRTRDGDTADGKRARESAELLRASLAHASRTWSRDQVEKFAGELAHIAPTLPASVGYLFADHEKYPMSEAFTVAVADSLDAYERDTSTPSVLYAGAVGDGAHYLADSDTARRIDDPMARVLQTLGEYPDAALDWLTNDTNGDDRTAFYYRVRNSGYREPGTGDGFEGVGALWAGAQQAGGSILDVESNDQAVQRKVATLSTEIFAHLAVNEALITEEISPGGSEQIATAVGQQIPQIAVNGINGEPNGDADSPPQRALFEIDNPEHRNKPSYLVNATEGQIAAVIGPALTRTEGLNAISAESTRYGEQVVASINAHADEITETEAGRQVAQALRVDAAFEGARMGELLGTLARDEAAVRHRVDLATGYASGKIPLPGGHAGIEVKGLATGGITDLVVDNLSNAAEDIAEKETQRAKELDNILTEKSNRFIHTLDAHYSIGSVQNEIKFQKGEADSKYDAWKAELAP